MSLRTSVIALRGTITPAVPGDRRPAAPLDEGQPVAVGGDQPQIRLVAADRRDLEQDAVERLAGLVVRHREAGLLDGLDEQRRRELDLLPLLRHRAAPGKSSFGRLITLKRARPISILSHPLSPEIRRTSPSGSSRTISKSFFAGAVTAPSFAIWTG